ELLRAADAARLAGDAAPQLQRERGGAGDRAVDAEPHAVGRGRGVVVDDGVPGQDVDRQRVDVAERDGGGQPPERRVRLIVDAVLAVGVDDLDLFRILVYGGCHDLDEPARDDGGVLALHGDAARVQPREAHGAPPGQTDTGVGHV